MAVYILIVPNDGNIFGNEEPIVEPSVNGSHVVHHNSTSETPHNNNNNRTTNSTTQKRKIN